MREEIISNKIVEHLLATDIFADVPLDILKKNAPQLNLLHFTEQEFIIRKNETGGTMFIIVYGNVKVHDDDFVVATLHTGDYFGEMSLLHTSPRSMSVSALGNVEVIRINQESFYNILKDQPDLIKKLISNLVIRLRAQNDVMIAEFKSREEELKRQVEEQTYLYREQKDRAEQSEKFKQQFLANMSHEIRTPMNAVTGMTNLLIDKNPRNDQIHYLDGIKKSGEILLHIINDILDLSKIEAGKMELEKIDFSVREVVEQVKLTLQHKAEEKGIELKTEIDNNITDILLGDPVRLNQILINLTGNAIKFTEEGSVMIGLKLHEKTPHQNQIIFSVSDTGIGIPQDKLETIFEGFSQANASDNRKFGGTGLGLTISKQLVEMMDSNILIESIEANDNNDFRGTTFSFRIGFDVGSVERLHKRILSEEHLDGSILDGLHVLIVDDNEYNRIVAADTLLSKSNIHIVSVESASEAIQALHEKHFDVVLMDLQMPEMNGYEASRYIREKFSAPIKDIPIIALTASVLRNDIDKCQQAGMNSYIAKPFKASELIAGIARVLNIELRHVAKNTASKVYSNVSSNKITDLAYLTKFCEGDTARMQKYIGMFTNSAPSLIQKINDALLANDFEEIANQVHGCRTKLVMMGMEESRQLSIVIEKECRDVAQLNKPISNIQKLITQLEKAAEELK